MVELPAHAAGVLVLWHVWCIVRDWVVNFAKVAHVLGFSKLVFVEIGTFAINR